MGLVNMSPAYGSARSRTSALAAMRAVASRGVPQRPAVFADVSAADRARLSTPGIRRDIRGIPLNDSSRDMHQYKAVGLGDDPGVYHEMSRGDPAIAGVFGLTDRAAGSASYRVAINADGGDKLNDEEREIEAFVRRFYGLDGTPGWLDGGLSRLMVQSCDAQRYGFVPFEVTAKRVEWKGRETWVPGSVTRMAPSSIYSWIWDGDKLAGIGQLMQQTYGWSLSQRIIPIWKTLLLTHQHRDGNPGGTSLIRPVWTPWEAKKGTFFRSQQAEENQYGGTVTVERRLDASGNPVLTAGDEGEARKVLDEIRELYEDGNLGYMEPPEGYVIKQDHPEFQIPSKVDFLEYCNREIFLTLHAVFFGLSSASASLSGDTLGMLYASLQALVDENLRTINGLPGVPSSGLTRRVVDWHFGEKPGRRYPEVIAEGIERKDLQKYADGMTKAYQYFLATPSVEDELMFRRVNHLPYVDPELIRANLQRREQLGSIEISQGGTQAPVEPPTGGANA